MDKKHSCCFFCQTDPGISMSYAGGAYLLP